MLDAVVPPRSVVGASLAVRPAWMRRPVARIAVLAVPFARDIRWRRSVTVLPADDLSARAAFVWTLFAIECLSWLDAGIPFAALARQTDRSPEADAHEARLRACAPEALPVVGVVIATCDEPIDVIEKTIVGALSLGWPGDRLRVWVLDDGRRAWLRAHCEAKGAGDMTRGDNAHAKAGNVNAGIARTGRAFCLVPDADVVPRQDFLFRAIGIFEDPSIGIVHAPHDSFVDDPMQTSLALQRSLPDDRRLVFDTIMPGRDGWDRAFCCGSNGIIRHRGGRWRPADGLDHRGHPPDALAASQAIRDALSLRAPRRRPAPESLHAFVIQHVRWAKGGIRTLFLEKGPLGPGPALLQRLFLPTRWLSLTKVVAMASPAVFLWTGIVPMRDATADTLLSYGRRRSSRRSRRCGCWRRGASS